MPHLQPLRVHIASLMLCFVGVVPTDAIYQAQQPRQLTAGEIPQTSIAQVKFQTIVKGYRSGVRAPLQVVARNHEEWETLWRRHASIDVPPPPFPAIDFEKFTVIGLFLGDKPTGGYDVEIIRAEPSNADLVILYRETSPTGRGMVIQSLTQPFHIVQITGAVNSGVIFRRSL